MVMATMMLIVMMMLAGRVAALGSLLGSGHGHVRPATADLGATHRPERRSSLKPPRRAEEPPVLAGQAQ